MRFEHSLKNKAIRLAFTIAGTFAAYSPAMALDMTGAGSTFVYPILSKWSSDYSKETGNKVNYQSIGSGGGIAQIKAATVDFGASDMPLRSDDLAKSGLGQFPSVIGGVVPVINVAGVGVGVLKFTGPVLADIFLGKVDKWNADAIKSLNPGVSLPDTKINVVHRSDGSGTTFNWASYLSKVSPEWKTKVGEGTSLAWPSGIGGKGNEGVAAFVAKIPNSIGYVEYAYAVQTKMNYASVQNKAGNFVKPEAKTFQAAAASADWAHAKDFDLVMTDAPGKDAYPITATTFVIMYKKPKNPAQSKAALAFFKWSLEKGQKQAEDLSYVALPAELVKQVEAYWQTEFNVNSH